MEHNGGEFPVPWLYTLYTMDQTLFKRIVVGNDGHAVYQAYPQDAFDTSAQLFDMLWALRPAEYSTVKIMGKVVATPRWSQTYGRDYYFSGTHNIALPIPPLLVSYLTWSQEHIDPALNGLLVNWYDGALGHYIGKHRDDKGDMQRGKPIVTISLGQERIFRLRPYGTKGGGYQDLLMKNGSVVVLPDDTNHAYTHEVPKFKKYQEKRISITLRAYR